MTSKIIPRFWISCTLSWPDIVLYKRTYMTRTNIFGNLILVVQWVAQQHLGKLRHGWYACGRCARKRLMKAEGMDPEDSVCVCASEWLPLDWLAWERLGPQNRIGKHRNPQTGTRTRQKYSKNMIFGLFGVYWPILLVGAVFLFCRGPRSFAMVALDWLI